VLGLELLEGKREGSAALAATERSGMVMGLAKRGTGAKRPRLFEGLGTDNMGTD
jgi:hypothetical protein